MLCVPWSLLFFLCFISFLFWSHLEWWLSFAECVLQLNLIINIFQSTSAFVRLVNKDSSVKDVCPLLVSHHFVEEWWYKSSIYFTFIIKLKPCDVSDKRSIILNWKQTYLLKWYKCLIFKNSNRWKLSLTTPTWIAIAKKYIAQFIRIYNQCFARQNYSKQSFCVKPF